MHSYEPRYPNVGFAMNLADTNSRSLSPYEELTMGYTGQARWIVMWQRLEAEACLLQLEDGRSVGL